MAWFHHVPIGPEFAKTMKSLAAAADTVCECQTVLRKANYWIDKGPLAFGDNLVVIERPDPLRENISLAILIVKRPFSSQMGLFGALFDENNRETFLLDYIPLASFQEYSSTVDDLVLLARRYTPKLGRC